MKRRRHRRKNEAERAGWLGADPLLNPPRRRNSLGNNTNKGGTMTFNIGDQVCLTGERWGTMGTPERDTVWTITFDDADDLGPGFIDQEGYVWYLCEGYEAELVLQAPDGRPVEDALRDDLKAVDPDHYKFPGGAEVIDISQWITANCAQALQYIARSSRIDGKNKGNAAEDLQKAIRFLNFELARLGAGE